LKGRSHFHVNDQEISHGEPIEISSHQSNNLFARIKLPPMNFYIDEQADPDSLLAEVRKGIGESDPHDVGDRDWKPVNFALRSDDGSMVGGIHGATMWGWLMIDGLWLSPTLRGQGLGRKLLLAAETEAISRGCKGSWLGTFDFQARDFYEHLGYMVFAELPGFPPGHTHFHLKKDFDASASPMKSQPNQGEQDAGLKAP
jgi:GNAT superfamily N-acetyltransferase